LTDGVGELACLKVCDGARSQARVSLFFARERSGRLRDQLCKLSKVLGGGSEEELVTSMPL
jgi:hypothetical protein